MKIIDLTYEIKEGMTTFSSYWHPLVSVNKIGRLNFEGRCTSKISLGSHTGTHIDAPAHFIKDGETIENLSLYKLFGKVSILDFSFMQEDESVTKVMLESLSLCKKVLFNFGWGRHWDTKKFYKGYPFFSKEAAEYLVSLNLDLIGMDTPSPDDSRILLTGDVLGSELDSPIHKIFLRNNIVLLEYVANLDQVSDYEGWMIVSLPMKVKGSDGSAARVFIYKEEGS